jgi:cobalt/nickel transport protein
MDKSRRVFKMVLLHLIAVPVLLVAVNYFSHSQKSWSGLDEAVVEKVAEEHGRPAKAPLIDPGSGDLLLFVFLVAGAAGGFLAGYNWRELTKKT